MESLFFDGGAAAAREGMKTREALQPAGDVDQTVQAAGEMGEKVGFPPFETEKSIRPQGLHQALGRGQKKEPLKLVPSIRRPGKIKIKLNRPIAAILGNGPKRKANTV